MIPGFYIVNNSALDVQKHTFFYKYADYTNINHSVPIRYIQSYSLQTGETNGN